MSAEGDTGASVVLRMSASGDHAGLMRLAELEGAARPIGLHLVAEQDGELRAALPLEGGAPIADPFRATAELVSLLELRALQLRPTAAPAPSRLRGLPARARGSLSARLTVSGTPARR